ncbi:hypothetical protein [Burkholderia anthina]|uniref:hypothetical protein n=1 Tax=Burkholderia anthina TaxID=179879 RepID=UPI001589F309|nr:hypothetical protein [Burkholderia anthina]
MLRAFLSARDFYLKTNCVDRFNRQLHPEEKQVIKKLAGNGENKEHRLKAAACALVQCAAEYAPGTPDYARYAGNGTAALSAVGGGVVFSPGNGTATVIGVGAGANLGKTSNPASVGMGYTVAQGKTGVRW